MVLGVGRLRLWHHDAHRGPGGSGQLVRRIRPILGTDARHARQGVRHGGRSLADFPVSAADGRRRREWRARPRRKHVAPVAVRRPRVANGNRSGADPALRHHVTVLRFAGAARGVRSPDPERADGDPLIGSFAVPQQAIPTDSLRRVVAQVFTRPEYQWVERRRLASWLARQWQHVIDWLNNLATQHPVGYNMFLAVVVLLLVLLLVHVGYVM